MTGEGGSWLADKRGQKPKKCGDRPERKKPGDSKKTNEVLMTAKCGFHAGNRYEIVKNRGRSALDLNVT